MQRSRFPKSGEENELLTVYHGRRKQCKKYRKNAGEKVFFLTPKSERKRLILETLGEREMTAREIAQKLNFSDLNAVKPRITELCNAGMLEACGKSWDARTARRVSVYRRIR